MQRYGTFYILASVFANICMKNMFYNIILCFLTVFSPFGAFFSQILNIKVCF